MVRFGFRNSRLHAPTRKALCMTRNNGSQHFSRSRANEAAIVSSSILDAGIRSSQAMVNIDRCEEAWGQCTSATPNVSLPSVHCGICTQGKSIIALLLSSNATQAIAEHLDNDENELSEDGSNVISIASRKHDGRIRMAPRAPDLEQTTQANEYVDEWALSNPEW